MRQIENLIREANGMPTLPALKEPVAQDELEEPAAQEEPAEQEAALVEAV
jgi:hypothetical protein